MKLKSKLIGLLSVLLVVPALAACGPKNPSGTRGDKSVFEVPEDFTVVDRDVTITFYHTMGSTKAYYNTLKKYIESFQQKYPHITVEESQIGGYDEVRDQIETELVTGDSPNIAYCYADHVASYNKSKKVIKLESLIDSQQVLADGTILGYTDAEKADFIETYYNEGKQFEDGHMYTLPFLKSTEVLYYDKDFFDANGYEVPTTWDEMETLCRDIKSKHPTDIPLGYDSESNWFITMCEQLKSPYTSLQDPYFLFDNDANKNFVKKIRSWYKDGLVATSSTYANTTGVYGKGSFTSGLFKESGKDSSGNSLPRCYMCIGSSAGASNQYSANFLTDIAPIPQADPNNKKVISQGPSVCIFAKSDPLEVLASWLFVKYLTTNLEFQAEFSMNSGYVPVLKSVQENITYKTFLSKRANKSAGMERVKALSAYLCLEQKDNYFVSPAFVGSSDARDAVGNLLFTAMRFPVPTSYTQASDIANYESNQISALFQEAVAQCELAAL